MSRDIAPRKGLTSVHAPDLKVLFPPKVRMILSTTADDSDSEDAEFSSVGIKASKGFRPDPSVPGRLSGGENEITQVQVMDLFGVEPGNDPNCMHSDDDFVITSPHPKFQLLTTEREGFAKVFLWKSEVGICSHARTPHTIISYIHIYSQVIRVSKEQVYSRISSLTRRCSCLIQLSSFEWKLKCEYASSKTGAWQQPLYELHHVYSPEVQVGLVLGLGGEKGDAVVLSKI